MDMLRKTAIITGASGGIGAATALKFAQNGYNLALTYCKGSTKSLEKQLESYGVEVRAYKLDQTDEKELAAFVRAVFKDFEYVDALVCNAGKAEKTALLIDKTISEIDEILSVNLRGTILLNREVGKYFIKQNHGVIINVSSIYGLSGGACETPYSAAKAGVIGLTKSLAWELAPYSIRVNAVAPGCIDTKMTQSYTDDDRTEIIANTPLARMGKPEDVASLIYFLASDEASFITGECYSITGGVLKF